MDLMFYMFGLRYKYKLDESALFFYDSLLGKTDKEI